MKWAIALFVLGFAAALMAAAQPVPSTLTALATKARLDGPVAAWCSGEFRPGRPGGYAVAVTSGAGGGRYVVLDTDATVTELALFKRAADLSCYSRGQAEKLDVTISRSETIQGHIAPRWNTTVVCGFIDETTAACWQYSPAGRTFVKVGEWVT